MLLHVLLKIFKCTTNIQRGKACTTFALIMFLMACSNPVDAPSPTAEEIYIEPNQYGGRLVEKIDIKQGEQVIQEIVIDTNRWEGEVAVYIGLPYEKMSWATDKGQEAFAAWDPIVASGSPALVVQEYVSGGSAPGSHRWVMRSFLWDDGALRELPPIPGAGEVYYFKDLNGDGSLEFVNQEGLGRFDLSEDGLPLSPLVYQFDGERFLPVVKD